MTATPDNLRPVREIDHSYIVMSDGTRLAARIWLPADADADPVPAILEYLPYRKRDLTAPRDEGMHPWMAARGYACVRVDIRGNGESDGLMHDEYLPQELDDGVEVIDWISRQSWCTGKVGIMGISWGGFNGLQIAAKRPPALAAIVTVCSTDDRYADDIHYKGGCLLNDNLAWGATMLARSARPPDPALAGDDWRSMWRHRLENLPHLAENWLIHQRRDAFWEHGSVCEDPSSIKAAVLAVGGWADAYSNAIPRMLATFEAPSWGLIGPWGHKYPHLGTAPGPAMDFLDEMQRWWDRWLKDDANSFRDVPALRAYILDGPDSDHGPDERPGLWVAENQWPSPRITTNTHYLAGDQTLAAAEAPTVPLTISSPLTVGIHGGRYYPRLGRPDMQRDQRADDAGSLCFDGQPLEAPMDILGAPVVELDLWSDSPTAQIAARLCAVAPDGRSHRITFGLLNLNHRNGHARPEALPVGKPVRVRVQMDDIGYRVPAGWHLRVALSTSYWPMIWPSPAATTLTVLAGSARLETPVRPTAAGSELAFEPPPALPPTAKPLDPPQVERRVIDDIINQTLTLETVDDTGLSRIESSGLESRLWAWERYSIDPRDPLSARAETHWINSMARGDWRVVIDTKTSMHADAENFYIHAELAAWEDDNTGKAQPDTYDGIADHEKNPGTDGNVFRKTWQRTIRRDNL